MKKEQWTAIGLFVLALITIYESARLSVWEHGSPTSGTFPMVLGILLAMLSFLFFLRSTLKGKKRIKHELRAQWVEDPEPVVEASRVDWKKVLLSMAAVLAYPFLFMKGGYIVGTAIFLLFMCKGVERMKILPSLVITAVTLLVSYTIFGILLKVPLH